MEKNPYESPRTEASEAIRATREPKRRFTPMFWIGIANLILWHVGIAFDSMRGLDSFGAFICISTHGFALALVPLSIFLSVAMWLSTSRKQWDFYGPAIALISVVLIVFEVEMNARS